MLCLFFYPYCIIVYRWYYLGVPIRDLMSFLLRCIFIGTPFLVVHNCVIYYTIHCTNRLNNIDWYIDVHKSVLYSAI